MSTNQLVPFLRGAVVLSAVLGLAAASGAQQVVTGGCLEDVSPGGVNCTANDVTFTLVGLGVQTDGCVQSGLGTCSNDPVVSCADDADCAAPGTCEYLDELGDTSAWSNTVP
ncbi:MAG: hypothetical protein OES32_18135 [Acidobacteriota bacterium]|nr:hypothetical protein [Acidobacteriota bacterium]